MIARHRTFTSKGPAGRRTLQRGGFLARIIFMASHVVNGGVLEMFMGCLCK